MRWIRAAALSSLLALSAGCQPHGPRVEPSSPVPPPGPGRTLTREAPPEPPKPSRVSRLSPYEGPVIEESLVLAASGSRWMAAFESRDGGVHVVSDAGRVIRVAERARVGCMRGTEAGFQLAVYERSRSLPIHEVRVHDLNPEGLARGPAKASAPDVWADPGSRCVFHGSDALVLRARQARPDAALDLWWVPVGRSARPAEMGVHVPSIRSGVKSGDGAIVRVEQVVEQDDGKVIREELWRVDGEGHFEAMPDVLLGDAMSVAEVSESVLVAARLDGEAGLVAWGELSEAEPQVVEAPRAAERVTLVEMRGASWAMLSGAATPLTFVELGEDGERGALPEALIDARAVVLEDGEVVVLGLGPEDAALRGVHRGVRGFRGLRGADGLIPLAE